MNDLISKQALLYALDDTALTDDGGVDINELEDLIKRMPIIEARHARWKNAGMGDYMCSLCSEFVSGNKYRYCPSCGAKMQEDQP